MIINRSALDRGFAHASIIKSETVDLRDMGGRGATASAFVRPPPHRCSPVFLSAAPSLLAPRAPVKLAAWLPGPTLVVTARRLDALTLRRDRCYARWVCACECVSVCVCVCVCVRARAVRSGVWG